MNKNYLFLFLLFLFIGCAQDGIVLTSTDLYQDEALQKKTEYSLKRGEYIKILKCSQKTCRVSYEKNIEGYVALDKIYGGEVQIVTFIKDTDVKLKPDLTAKTLKKAESGVKAYLFGEDKIWSLVNLGDVQGWVLMQNLFKGESPIRLESSYDNTVLQCEGEWYIPSISEERVFSIEKAFDNNPSTFAIVKIDSEIEVNVKNIDYQKENLVIQYEPQKKMNYKHLALPEEILLTYPFEKQYNLNSKISIELNGNSFKFKVTKAKKDLVFLNNFFIQKLNK